VSNFRFVELMIRRMSCYNEHARARRNVRVCANIANLT